MRRVGRRRLAFVAVSAGILTARAAVGGSAWFALDPEQTVCDVSGTGACSIELSWVVGNEDKFDKWKLCWKVKEAST